MGCKKKKKEKKKAKSILRGVKEFRQKNLTWILIELYCCTGALESKVRKILEVGKS